jgi:hypothetical protein
MRRRVSARPRPLKIADNEKKRTNRWPDKRIPRPDRPRRASSAEAEGVPSSARPAIFLFSGGASSSRTVCCWLRYPPARPPGAGRRVRAPWPATERAAGRWRVRAGRVRAKRLAGDHGCADGAAGRASASGLLTPSQNEIFVPAEAGETPGREQGRDVLGRWGVS